MRKAGILLPVSSLPSRHGIGDMGDSAKQFIDRLAEMKVKIWQILPMNPLGYGNSPYQPYSSFAGEPRLINLDKLIELGLLKNVKDNQPKCSRIDYQQVNEFKHEQLRRAFTTFQKLLIDSKHKLVKEFIKFCRTNNWVENYAVFIALKEQNDLKCWLEWPEEEKAWIKDQKYDLNHLTDEIMYQKFVQFIFQKQWLEIKKYANKKGIEIMGDIPIYVGIDSLDVWENQACFRLNKNGNPTVVAGVPPDYFSKKGQRWGNPLYDWDYLKKTNFEFWIKRLELNRELFDIIRVDHFRAFDTYWEISAKNKTAMKGQWLEAPGYELLDEVYKRMPDFKMVAEDLGDMRDEVYELRDHYDLMGMKIIQFTFDPDETNNDFEDRENMIVYTGTHDNDTIVGWFTSQRPKIQKEATAYFKEKGYKGKIHQQFVQFALESIADYAIIPIQDVIGQETKSRINTPGTLGSPNWEYKLSDFKTLDKEIDFFQKLVKLTKRN
ncbi:MAG: 4-alpha-glucanotransferase [Mycoplasmatales bacterium]